MTIQPIAGQFTVCQANDPALIDWAKPFTFAARTDQELSLVCRTTDALAHTVSREDGWRAFRICGPLDFSLVGVLAGIASILAKERISIFAVSTYDTDYILVREERFGKALDALRSRGYIVAEECA